MLTITKSQKRYYLWTGKDVAVNLDFILKRKGIEFELFGIFLGKKTDKFLLKVTVRHIAGNTKSRIIVRGILSDRAYADFRGRVNIKKGAKRVDTHLEAKSILLSSEAKNRLEPYLEIDENDVKASHSTYAGPVDEKDVFYLRSRGLSEDDARKLLLEGFLSNIVAGYPDKLRKRVFSFLK